MIKGVDLHKYTLNMSKDTSCGWKYGPSWIHVHHGYTVEPHAGTRYWWAFCRRCGQVALCTLRELQNESDCNVCGWSIDSDPHEEFDWSADRSMRSMEFEQEACSSAYLLGGLEPVQAIATAHHQAVKASLAAHHARIQAAQAVIEPVGADLQEAESEAP